MEPMPYECEYETSYYPWSQAETVFSWQFETEAVRNLFSTSGDIRIYQEFGLSDICGSFSPAAAPETPCGPARKRR